MLLLTKDEGPGAGSAAISGSGLADAMILMDIELDDERMPGAARDRPPSVLIGLPGEPRGLTCVDLDFAATGGPSSSTWPTLGHRDIAVIGESDAVYGGTPGSPPAPWPGSGAGPGNAACGWCTARARADTPRWP